MPSTKTINDIKFLEQRHTHFYHDVRVFICGVEVSHDLRGTLAVSISDGKAPSTATLTLDNALDKYIYTESNAEDVWGADPYRRYDETPKKAIVYRKLEKDGYILFTDRTKTIEDEIKKRADELTKNMGPNSEFDSVTQDSINVMTDELIQDLNDDFFTESTSTETKDAVFRAVTDRFGPANTFDAQKLFDTIDKSSSRRGGAISNAAQQTTSGHIAPRKDAATSNPTDAETGVMKWQFDPGDIVINKHDTVRIYAHNPFHEPAGLEGGDQWYPVFTGFVNTVSERTDETIGESSLTISCYCIRAVMKQMRLSLNSAIAVYEPQLVFKDAGYFSDAIDVNGTAWVTNFQGLTIEEIVCKLVTGSIDSKLKRKTDTSATSTSKPTPPNETSQKKINGVGRFTLGGVLRYQSAETSDSGFTSIGTPLSTGDTSVLEQWHGISIFGNSASPEKSGNFLSYDEVTKRGVRSCRGGDYDPFNCKLHMLLPDSGTNVDTLAQYVVDDHNTQFAWDTRYNVILQLVERLDYQFYTSPNGDLLLEFPMLDFAPEDFGPIWAPLFRYFGHVIDSSEVPEGEEIPAGYVVTGSIPGAASFAGGSGDGTGAPQMNRVIAYSKIVAARYGINEIKQEHLPFLNSVERTKAYAAIKYQRALADASSLTFTAAHRPFIMPNRPILLERRNKLGMSIAVEHSWEITGNVSTEVSVKCIRKRVKVGNQYIYRFVTGGSAMAISYRVPVKSEVPPTGKPTSEAQAKAAKYVNDQQSTQQTRAYYSAAGYKNGQPIEVTLVDIAPGKGLVPDAALAWNAMKAAAKDDIGVEFGVNYAFRTMEQQRALYNGGSKAAKPGYSSHQQGISVDISGVHGYSTNQYKWLSEHASAFGFVDDARKQGEYWHWTFTGSSTAPAESEHESVGKDADPGAPELVASTSDDDTEQAAPDVKTNASSGVTTASTSDAKKTAAKDVTSTPTQATQNPVQQATTSPPKPA